MINIDLVIVKSLLRLTNDFPTSSPSAKKYFSLMIHLIRPLNGVFLPSLNIVIQHDNNLMRIS